MVVLFDSLKNLWVLFWTDLMWAFMILCPVIGGIVTKNSDSCALCSVQASVNQRNTSPGNTDYEKTQIAAFIIICVLKVSEIVILLYETSQNRIGRVYGRLMMGVVSYSRVLLSRNNRNSHSTSPTALSWWRSL